MKTSSVKLAPPTIDKPTAWACALTNAATLPGLGTLVGGRRVGFAQAACALVGFGLSLGGLLGHLRVWYDTGEMPREFTASLAVALVGLGLFGFAWLWALASSIRLHRQASRPPLAPESDDAAASHLPPRL